MADSFQSYKVTSNEQSSATKFNNLVQALEDAINSLDDSNIAAAAAIAVSKLAAGSSGDILATSGGGVPVWTGISWQSYSPAWTSTGTQPTIGNGTVTGRYSQVGKTVDGWVNITMGSTTSYGSGAYLVSLPVTANTTTATPVGIYRVLDASPVVNYNGWAIFSTVTTIFFEPTCSPTAPITFATGDTLNVRFSYEAA